MKLIKLKADNFKQYKQLGPIEFPEKGIIGIIGDTGSGKSTVFNAIELALFGNVSGTKMSELKHRESKKSDKWSVELTFEFNNIVYLVTRNETTSKAELFADGKQIQVGQRAVSEHIEDVVLKMNQEAFLNAFYAKQDDIDSLSKMKNEERKREISSLLGIDDIDKAIKSSRADKNKVNIQIEELKRHIKNSDNLEAYLKEKEAERNKIKKILDEAKVNEGKITNELKNLELNISNLEKDEITFNELNTKKTNTNNELILLTNNLNSLKKEQNELNELEKIIKEYEGELVKIEPLNKEIELSKQYLSLSDYLEKLKNNLIEQKSKIDQLVKNAKSSDKATVEEKVSSIDKELTKLEDEKKLLAITVNTILYDLNKLKEEGTKVATDLNAIKKLGDSSCCPTCKQTLGESFNIIVNDYNNKIADLRMQYSVKDTELNAKKLEADKLNKNINLLTNNKETLMKELRANEAYFVQLETERGIFNRLKNDYNEFVHSESGKLLKENEGRFTNEKLNSDIELLDSLLEKRSYYNVSMKRLENKPKLEVDIKNKTSEIKRNNEELTELNKQIKNLNFDGSALTANRNKVTELRNAYKNVSNSLNEALLLDNNIKRDIDETTKVIQENNEKLKDLESKTSSFKNLLYLDEAFKLFKVKKLSEVSPAIANTMSSLLSYLTDGKYDKVTLDEDYNVFVNRNGKDQPYHMFSGGEKKLFSLVQRLSISQIITRQRSTNNFEFLALDEVVGSLDNDKQYIVLESLQKINGVFKQIFMITHNQDLNTMFDYALEVKQNENLTSHIDWSY